MSVYHKTKVSTINKWSFGVIQRLKDDTMDLNQQNTIGESVKVLE